jgi:Mrp family chromosome partitioning ATPase
MGRMLETLKLGEGRRTPLAVSKPADAAPVQDCVVDWEIGEEVPYVEVGGPNKKVELSPSLMKHPPQTTPQAPHLAVEVVPIAAKPKTLSLIETKPMTAAFEPWPVATPTPLGISQEIIAYHQPDHATSKEYAALLETMRGGLKNDAAKVMLLIGLKPHVGTSTVLVNLAVCAAIKQNSRVIVVDANTHRGGLAKKLGHASSGGLLEVMAGNLALEQAIVKTGIAALDLLPGGLAAAKPSPLTGEAMAWLIARLRERFDLIFIDSPSMENAADLTVHVPHADGIYLVLPQGENHLLNKGVAQTISRMGGRLCGLIHTHFDM